MSERRCETLRSALNYDARTGVFTWNRSSRRVKKGAVAGSRTSHGYISISVDGRAYYAHRLAWLFVHGRWPTEIDHANGDKSDNRISNLRDCRRWQNEVNTPAKAVGASGYRGVWPKGNRWVAHIMADGNRHCLGSFGCPIEAAKAYDAAAIKHHGEFATVNFCAEHTHRQDGEVESG